MHEADRLEVPRGRAGDGSLQTADWPGCGERAVGREAGGPGWGMEARVWQGFVGLVGTLALAPREAGAKGGSAI